MIKNFFFTNKKNLNLITRNKTENTKQFIQNNTTPESNLTRKERWNKEFGAGFIDSHIINYPTPSNINYFWSFGAVAGICLVIQILTGIFLAMYYIPHESYAFASVEFIMRDVPFGYQIRYTHANGASFFFLVVYAHIFRGLYYNVYSYPNEKIWISGIVIFFLMMATAFMGYVLPWGQMSLWGATVITNLFSAIPEFGKHIVTWIWGGFCVGAPTLNRFYSFHYLLPFLITSAVIIHLSYLHKAGSSNPTGLDRKLDNINFHPYFTLKDLFSLIIVLIVFSLYVFFRPNDLGHPDNYLMANSLSTPAHIVPEWYFLPFYAILRSIPDKLGGVVAMISAILVLLLLPIINTSKIRSSKFRPIFGVAYWFLVSDFLLLGWIGQKPVESPYIEIGMGATVFYFVFLLVLIPLIGIIESAMIQHNDGFIVTEPSEEDDIYFGHSTSDKDDLDTLDKHPRLFFVPELLPVTFQRHTNVNIYLL